MVGPSRYASLSLFRQLMRNAVKFTDYNFRMYAQRRIRAGFVETRAITSKEEAAGQYRYGQTQLELVRRQALISSLYPETPSVLTVPPK